MKKWHDLHFRTAPTRHLNLIQVERLTCSSKRRKQPPLWLVWVGFELCPLADVWSQYARRFGVDHWYRFAKQRLHWTLPNLSTPGQCERWSDLMPLMTWQLWLARDLVSQQHLPWATPQTNLTPGRVAQSIFAHESEDWLSNTTTENPRKVSWLAIGSKKKQEKHLSHCQEAVFSP
ncbi:hypothetical protein [Moorena sp. SIO3I8]|uniref:hypothetical protein n=1 Tax=Moorena sp. SIO3I8 TaxID=2607833 RepID=UPI0025D92F67|nr:hypothetical protein [Moorena sp. SIO3I8]